jgi:Tol biopolymer transport system component
MADHRPSEMGLLPDKPESVGRPEERLNSWKQIAAYLNRDVTTAQRWEKREGMPVHRHVHDKVGSVYAFRSELDAWVRSRRLERVPDSGNGEVGSVAPAPRLHALRFASLRKWKFVLPIAGTGAILAIGASLWLARTEYFWHSPIADARFRTITNFDGAAQAAAISRDGQFVAFLLDRVGQTDVWVTQVGSGQFQNLTQGKAPELVNPSVRTIGFSPDGSLVTFWVRKQSDSSGRSISIWAVPTLGGEPKPYLEDAAEYDWSRDGTRLAYHTIAPGDPLFVSDGNGRPGDRPIFTAPAGLHCHFPLWSPDSAFVYFVEGALPDKLNVWRMPPTGGKPEQITPQPGLVRYPVLLNRRTLLYLSSDADGSGPWLYSLDVERRIPHRLTFGPEMYTSLAGSADGRRVAATVAIGWTTLWRVHIGDSPAAAPEKIQLTSDTEDAPRLGPDYLVYVSSTGTTARIWKLTKGNSTELWRSANTRIIGAPAISPDGRQIAFPAQQHGQKLLYVMRSDGSNARTVADSLDLQGDPSWMPDGHSITTAANEHGMPQVFRVPLGGSPTPLAREYSLDPVWAPDGRFFVYSGPDIGTTFSVKATTAEGAEHPLPALTLTRGARHVALLNGGRALVMLRGGIQHKNLWMLDLQTGAEQQLTNVPSDFDIRDFDISPDGREAILERVQDRSEVVLLELPHS